jgi:hypothetical protein
MRPVPAAPLHRHPASRMLSNREEQRAQVAVIDARPIAMRGLLIGAAAVLPFWATLAAVIWRLVGAH